MSLVAPAAVASLAICLAGSALATPLLHATMNEDGISPSSPGIIGTTVTWTNGGNIPSTAYGTQFVIMTSTDLVNWTPVAANDPQLANTAGSVSYTLPPGAGRLFVRLVVTPG